MITINVKEGILAAAAAFDAGRLQANNLESNDGCTYRDEDNVPCVVGAMISDEDWKRDILEHTANGGSANRMGVDSLIENIITWI